MITKIFRRIRVNKIKKTDKYDFEETKIFHSFVHSPIHTKKCIFVDGK